MKLYFFACGTLESQKHLFTAGRGIGQPFTVPVPFFLIDHPKGKVLFDTGNALPVATDPHGHWGNAAKAYYPNMAEGDYILNQLQAIGVNAEDIAYVILSHLHLDHAGGVGAFPNAQYIVQRAELHWAYVPDFYQKGAYIRADFDRDVEWMILEGRDDDDYDVFGDGTIRIWFTPGHTPGHQSILVKLPESGAFLLTGDSCYTEEILNEEVLPGLVWSPSEALRSIKRLRAARDNWGVKVVTGHDPVAWANFNKAPEYYR
ncbi:MAG: N-acyl homoserine lactonase family protein [Candidatus Methylumidiphilus sp.]